MIAHTDLPPQGDVQELAALARRYLVRGEREADQIGKILVTADDAPQWVTDLVRAAHTCEQTGYLNLPDDWTYEFIGDALDALEDDLIEPRSVDDLYPYTCSRLAWAKDCNEAMDGHEEAGPGPYDSLESALAWAMAYHMAAVHRRVWAFLEEMAEEDRS